MKEFSSAGLSKARIDRRRLKLGTVLGSGAAAAVLLVPAVAFANLPAGVPSKAPVQPGSSAPTVALLEPAAAFEVDHAEFLAQLRQAPSSAAPFLADRPAPQDLTVRPPTRFAAAASGDVNVSYGDITTTTDHTPGISTNSTGDTVITAGEITTSGDYSDGVSASGAGQISITTGNVSSYGAASTGISATAGGDISIVTQNVTTTGPDVFVGWSAESADGIYANSTDGNVTIEAQQVSTKGDYASGIIAKAAGDVTVTASTVIADGYGSGSRGILATSANGKATVSVDHVTTHGYYAAGMLVKGQSTEITVNGSVNTYGIYSSGIRTLSYGGDAVVHVNGSVQTQGIAARGVYAFAHYGGSTTIDIAGDVTTKGAYFGQGVVGGANGASVTITVTGAVQTVGKKSTGIYAGIRDYYTTDTGDITINAKDVSTSGEYSAAIAAVNTSRGGDVSIDVSDSVSTRQSHSSAITVTDYTGDVSVQVANNVSTRGSEASGVSATGNNITIGVGGTISTLGDRSTGVFASGTGDIDVTTAIVQTAGDKSNGIVAIGLASYDGPGTGSGINITAGSVSTAGDQSAAVYAFTSSGDVAVNVKDVSTLGANAGGVQASGIHVDVHASGTVSTVGEGSFGLAALGYSAIVQAATVTTAGYGAAGIFAYAGADATVTAASVTTSGVGATGVVALGHRDVTVDVKDVATTGEAADAIDAVADGLGSVTVRGSVSSGQSDGIYLSGADALLTITTGAKVSGVNGAVIAAVGPAGTATVANAGTLAGADYALRVDTGRAVITNTGTIAGAVKLAEGDDRLTNSGAFAASKDSDFGDGTDLFVNTGTLKVLSGTTTPGAASFLGLERFENTGGLVDLRNGHAGDVFTLTGDYVASGDARLGLDLEPGKADKLVIAGAAAGKTTILLGVTPATASLKGGAPTLVQTGAGSTATFVLGNADIGLIHYELTPGSGVASAGLAAAAAAPVSYSLSASAGAPVYAALNLEGAAQSAWRQSADAWSAHLAAMRGDAWAGGAGQGRFWAQAYGSNADRDGAGGVGYSQKDVGVQVGADLLSRATPLGDAVWGVTAGYASASVDGEDGLRNSDVDTLNLGGYVALSHGPLFANALVKLDRHQIKSSDTLAGYSVELDGSSWGAQFELGRRFGTDRLAFEPTASLSWAKSSLDDVDVYGQTLAFHDADGLIGKLGGRAYGRRALNNGTVLVWYAGAAAAQDFSGDQRLTFSSGGIAQNVSAKVDGTFGQATLGLSARTTRGLTVYVEGDGDFGAGRDGTGLRLGARFGF